jgi:hypothetical protein
MSWRSDCRTTYVEWGPYVAVQQSFAGYLPELMGDGTRHKSVPYHVGIFTRDTRNRGLQADAVRRHLGRYEVVRETHTTWQASRRESGVVGTLSQIVDHAEFGYLTWIFFSYNRHCLSKIWQMFQFVMYSETVFLHHID